MPTKNILVIENDPLTLKLLRVLLTMEGYQVTTLSDAESAPTQITASCPQLILMDLQLSGVDGLTLTRQLKSDPVTRNIPIIAVTTLVSKIDEDEAYEAGCDGYISKPIDTRTLPTLVARYFKN